MSNHTIFDWNNYLREVCALNLLANPIKIGGPHLHVEIDESLFVWRKYNVGHQVSQQQVFGGICQETKECFLYTVDRRDAATLLSIIEETILPGTIIISDEWSAYNSIANIPNRNYQHLTVNHSTNFVNPQTGAATNRIEGLWNKAKSRNRKSWGTHRSMIDSYMCEFMWRERYHSSDLFEQILTDIANFFPLN